MPYAVEMSDWALDFIDKHVTRETVFARIEWAIDILGEYPAFGPSYEPGYAAARPPFPCRYLPLSDTPFTLYYIKDDESKKGDDNRYRVVGRRSLKAIRGNAWLLAAF